MFYFVKSNKLDDFLLIEANISIDHELKFAFSSKIVSVFNSVFQSLSNPIFLFNLRVKSKLKDIDRS